MTGVIMLNVLRKKGFAKKIIWIVAIVIIISFGFFGTAYLFTGGGRMNYAGKIFGKKITLDDFNKVYQNIRIQAIRQYGYDLSEIEQALNLEAQTWDRMILLHEAKKRKFNVPNNAVVRAIGADPSFERNGRFDALLYNSILRNLRIRPRDYEESIRDNLKIGELYRQVTSSVVLTEEEILEEYQNLNEKIQVSYVFVSPESFKKDISIETSEVEQYYEDHKSEFLTAPMVDVRYLTFGFPEKPEETETTENPETETPSQEDQEDDLEKEKDIIREKADAVFQELLINPDMAEIAQKNNLKVQTSGFFSMEQPNLTLGWSYDLLDKIFKMDEDEINDPFESSNGLSIVQIKEKRDSYIPEFSEAQDNAREAVITRKAKEMTREKADEYLADIKEELDKSKLKDFPKAAKVLGLEIHQTPVFNRGQYLPQIGISKEFQEAAFQLTENNKISNVVETSTGSCFLYLDNYIPVENADYEENKENLAQTLMAEKRNTFFGDFVAQLRIKADLFNNLAQLRSQFE